MKLILFIALVFTPLSHSEDSAITQQDENFNTKIDFDLGVLSGESVYVVLIDRKVYFTIYSLHKGQLTENGFVIVNFNESYAYFTSPSAQLSIQTDSVRTISNQVIMRHVSEKDNIIVLEPTYNVEALKQEVTIIKEKYDKSRKEWLESDDTLRAQIEEVKEQKLAHHLENAQNILEVITRL